MADKLLKARIELKRGVTLEDISVGDILITNEGEELVTKKTEIGLIYIRREENVIIEGYKGYTDSACFQNHAFRKIKPEMARYDELNRLLNESQF